MVEVTVKQGDLFPDVEVTVVDEEGLVVDVTAYAFTFSMRKARDPATVPLTNQAAVIVNGPEGMIAYRWSGSQTDIAAGTYEGEFKAIPPSGDSYKIPTEGYITVHIQSKVA